MKMNSSETFTGCDDIVPMDTRFLRESAGGHPSVFGDIYSEEINIAIWQRELPAQLKHEVKKLLENHPSFHTQVVVTPEEVQSSLAKTLDSGDHTALINDIATLVDMFCCLFELEQVGVRLTAITRPMCPKFHVDKVPCRLLTTYQNAATEWLPDNETNRKLLGLSQDGTPERSFSITPSPQEIKQLNSGDVALLKGVRWEGNEKSGLIHRSPVLPKDHSRLLLTMDFVS